MSFYSSKGWEHTHMPNTVLQVWSDAVCPTHTLEHHTAMNRKKTTHMP